MKGSGRFAKINRLKVWLPLAVIAVLAAGGFMIVRGLDAPAVGSLNQTPPSQAETAEPYSQPGTFNGRYISFKYPAHFKTVPARLTGGYLEVASYSAADQSGRLINVGVVRGTVSVDSGAVYRRQHRELYRETDSRLGDEFTRLDGTEDTFFIQHDGLMATVSATAPGGGLDNEALFVASGLKWR